MVLIACNGSGDTSGTATLQGYRTEASRHKLQVDAQHADALVQRGGRLVADYGSFRIVEVDNAALATAAAVPTAELRDDYNVIRLNAGQIDTETAHGMQLRGMSVPTSGKQFQLIQFTGPIQPEWYASLEATGMQIVSYIPENAYLVYGDAQATKNLQALVANAKFIQWDGSYLNDYKLDPSLNTVDTGAYSIQLIKDVEANAVTLSLIDSAKRRDGVAQEALGYVDVIAYLDRTTVYQVAQQPDVVSIQPYIAPKLRDERQDIIMVGQFTGNSPTGPGYLAWLASKGFTQAQFTTSGFGVDLSDSGIDNGTQSPNHFGLYVGGDVAAQSRVVYNRLEGTPHTGSTIQGCDGHGNLNSHIIAGYDDLAGAPFADAAGFHYGLGIAPFVKVGSSVIFDPGTFTNPSYENLQSEAYRDGMRISSNSWGSSSNSYTTDAQRYDALVRDAQPSGSTVPVAGNQEMVIVFAAGNGGPGANTVGSPSTAKNVITVAASENVQPFGAPDQCNVSDTDADSWKDIVGFSSRGPTSDGRKKPDLAAPGTHISGGVAQTAGQRANPPASPSGSANSCFNASGVCAGPGTSDFWPLSQQWYTASSGTSHSTPATAGSAALLRQHFINKGLTPPSPAMTKAYLMNSATYMTGSGANDNLPSTNQGMGLVSLGTAFDGISRLIVDESAANLFTASGQTRTFSGVVSDTSKPFRVTLAWTDAPGSTTGSAWRNNLDLSVTIGGNTYRGNVFSGPNSVTGGAADASNNVESVFLPAGIEGPYTVTVSATNINSDGVPGNASSLDQDFALIVYNQCATAPAVPTGLTATASANNQVTLNWSGSATGYNVYRSTTTGGPYTRIASGLTATTYTDSGVSGGTTYFYVVRGAECAESAKSNEASVTATGVCTLPPTFAGVGAVNNGAASTCTNNVTWTAATPACGGAITYSVFRSTTPGFAPSTANRIATGVTGTSFADTLNLANNTTYYYVVRATETTSVVIEDTNTVQRSAAPTGVVTPAVAYFDDLDGNRPPNASAYWIPTTISGTAGTINLVNGCHYQSTGNAYRWGAAATTCGGTYPISTVAQLILGGNGSTPGVNGFAIPATTQGAQLTFSQWYNTESGWDGAYLVYSTTSANGPWTVIPDAPAPGVPYITTGAYNGGINSAGGQRAWNGVLTPANGSLRQVVVNIDALAGQTAWFGFHFSSDSSINFEGFYLDDVAVTAPAIASCTTSVPPPGPAVAYQIANLPSTVPSGAPVSFQVRAVDNVGQPAVTYSGTATLSSSDAAATLPATVTITAGVGNVTGTFQTLGSQTVTATDTSDPSFSGTATTTVTTGLPASMTFQVQPSNTVAGNPITPAVKVSALDSAGRPASGSISLSIGANPGGGTLSGTTTATLVNGVATFSNLSIDRTGTGYTLVANSGTAPAITSSAFNINPGPAAALAFTVSPPASSVAGAVFAPAVQVTVTDSVGNPVPSTASITVALGNNPSSGTLSGTKQVAAVNGVATFSNLSVDKVGVGYTLIATATGLPAVTSSAFAITPAAPYRLVLVQQPSDIASGAPITPAVTVNVLDRFSNIATQSALPVHLALGNNPSAASLGGTTTVVATGGVATFSDLTVNRAGAAYTLIAGTSGLFGDSSVGFDVFPGAPAKLVYMTQPPNGTAGAALAPAIQVAVEDANGNIVTTASSAVTVALSGGGGTLSGTLTAPAVNGIATFSDLSVDVAASGYTLAASSSGGETGATSSAFAIDAAAASALAFTVQPGTVRAGSVINPALQVTVKDSFGNTVRSSSASITIALGANPASGTLGGTLTASAANGVATFNDLTIDLPGTGYTLTAAAAGVTGATTNAFDVQVGGVAQAVFSAQPQSTQAGSTLNPSVTVTLKDAAGNVVTTASDTVTLTLQNGATGATLGGTISVPAVNGVATFSDLSIAKAGTGYTLKATVAGVPDVNSSAFDISAGPAAALVFTVQPSNTQASKPITPAVVITEIDAYGNTATSAADAITVALDRSGPSATLNGTATVTATNGVATFSDLSIKKKGTGYKLAATANGLTSATSSAFDITQGPPAHLTFVDDARSAVAGATLETITVALEDANGNVLTGVNGDVTLTLGANAAGSALRGTVTVTPVNGLATFSDLVITKAGKGYTLVASAAGFAGATSAAFDISSGPVASLAISTLPPSLTAGQQASFAVTALDAFGNVAEDYAGTVKATSSDADASLPNDGAFTKGALSGLHITFKTVGAQTVTVTDTNAAALTASASTNVTAFPQPTVAITAPGEGEQVRGNVTVTAAGNVAPGTTLKEIVVLVDGQVIGSSTTSPASITWDASKLQAGSHHTVSAVISDGAGNVQSSLPLGVIIAKTGCGCGATGGMDAGSLLALLAVARQALVWRRRRTQK